MQNMGIDASYSNRTGPFYRNSAVTFGQFTDGMSNSALFSEIRRGPHPGSGSSLRVIPRGDIEYYAVATNVPDADWNATNRVTYDVAVCDNPATSAWSYRGLQYYRGLTVATFYNHTLSPNSRYRDCAGISNGHLAARGFHTGGVNLARGDGSITFISDSIDLVTWKALGSINGGEAVTLPE